MNAKPSLDANKLKPILAPLKRANKAFTETHPGDSGERQPVHVVYGGAHLFKRDTAAKLGAAAVKALEENAPTALELAWALELPEGDFAKTLYARVREKLLREAVEDFRIDFEDGYGNRPDEEEDGHAAAAGVEVAEGLAQGTLPPFIGIRIKPLSEPLRARSLRTMDLFLTSLLSSGGKRLPPNFVITLPKITTPAQPAALAKTLDLLEKKLRLARGSLKVELMVETPQSIFAEDGTAALPRLVEACAGRCVAAHFGTYDYTASCNITAGHQTMVHPSCDFAKHMMQVTLAQRGIALSDGATNVMPVGDKETVHRAWKLHFEHIQHSLIGGFYEGWDLHPAQLPSRYAAVYSFFLQGQDAASARLKNFVEKAAQATLVGDVFDDAATGQGLLNFFLRGLNCGAITFEEAQATGLTREDFQSRSFLKILEGRRNTAR